ncbi:ABC transporter permease [Ruminococcus sp. FC2018]|uniref:ABC transporter permease n=1 Tax=Ruminococcus sp. FC2018 TaxID=1410617 RepID=UPI00048A6040|nr:ABC transporter permease [Ruminococcus sp. FC2018]
MNNKYYIRLSRENIKKNAKMYIPYLLICVLMMSMMYVIRSLASNPDFSKLKRGAEALPTLMRYGSYVTAAFAVVILFYSNSFILKRRNSEFGLLNILGMEKRHIAKLMLLETIYVAVITLVAGCITGLALERAVHLIFTKMLGDDAVDIGYHISAKSMLEAFIMIAVTLFATYLFTIRKLHFSNPVELLSGAKKGEKEPKTKLFMTIVGFLFIFAGYGLSFFVTDLTNNFSMIFMAVIFVIIGTYLLFIAGIIAMLKLLKKKKSYYYKTKHFTTLSGLVYRMKRNSVGLASTAVLSTMVLITVSSTMALMAGIEGHLPKHDAIVKVNYDNTGEETAKVEAKIAERVKTKKVDKNASARFNFKGRKTMDLVPFEKQDYSEGATHLYETKPGMEGGVKSDDRFDITVMPWYMINTEFSRDEQEDVLFKKEADEILESYRTGDGEVIIETFSDEFDGMKEFKLLGRTYKIKEVKNKAGLSSDHLTVFFSSSREVLDLVKAYNEISPMNSDVFYELDIDYDEPTAKADEAMRTVADINETVNLNDTAYIDPMRLRSVDKSDAMMAYGSIFFLGLFLGTLFIFETILIIYYKQLTEGYEDADRFRIMQSVGMSEAEVKTSIRSQILLVFFLPLITAIVHTVFAFPMVGRLLAYMGLDSTKTYLKCTLAGFGGYVVLYTVIYVLTAKMYYSIIRKRT